MIITIPGPQLTDDAGTLLTSPTVTIASVTDKAGTAIASPGATVNLAGPNVSVDYDAEAHGEAWITLAVSQAGSTLTGQRAAPVLYAAKNSSRILSDLDAQVSLIPGATVAALNADSLYSKLVHHQQGKFAYNPATKSLQLLLDDGTTALGAALTLTVDSSGNITARQ